MRTPPDARSATFGVLLRAGEDRMGGSDSHQSVSGGEARNVVQAGTVQGDINILGIPRSPHTVPHQLPRPATHFVNRQDCLDRLDALAGEDGGLAVLSGQAGVGKSALAVCWSHQAAGRFPDGQLYADLRGYHRLPPQPPEETLHSFLLALDAPMDRFPTRLSGMTSLYRSLLHGKRLLIVADNVREPQQILPLLPGAPGCFVLATSRNDLDSLAVTEGATTVKVHPLVTGDAVGLFCRLSGYAAGRQVAALVDRFGRLPLTVRIIAHRARAMDHVAALAADLAAAPDRLTALATSDDVMEVRRVLSYSYHSLSPDKARLFRLLSLHGGPDFSTGSAAALAGAPTWPTLRLLRALAADNLLEELSSQRFRFHDLVRDFAHERVLADETPAERNHAIRRELEFYLRHCDAADRVLAPERPHVLTAEEHARPGTVSFADHAEAVAWCDAEIVSLLAAVDQAVELRVHDLAWKLPIALVYYLILRQHRTYRHRLTGIALQAARRQGDTWAETWCQNALGGAEGALGLHEQATASFTRALALSEELDDPRWRSMSTHNLAWALRLAGRYDAALVTQEQALRLARELGDRRGEAIDLNELGVLCIALGRYAQARDHGENALVAARDVADLLTEAEILHQLGQVHTLLDAPDAAADRFEQAIRLRRRIDDRPELATSLLELGRLCTRTHPAQAHTALEEAVRLLETLADPRVVEARALLDSLG
ncbi:tetratricopeptide repeat protein [Streptomyces alboflavus]|nr:tetratricopeptide repeat protein [Streptomyces alboflavus]